MSKVAVFQLIEAAETNPKLLSKLQTAQGPEAVIAIASELGYEFSESELLDVMQEEKLSFASDEELSEEQLEAVVGGKLFGGKTGSKKVQFKGTGNETVEYKGSPTKFTVKN